MSQGTPLWHLDLGGLAVGTLSALTLSGWKTGEWAVVVFFILVGAFFAYLVYPIPIQDRTGQIEIQGSYLVALLAVVLFVSFGVGVAAANASNTQTKRRDAVAQQTRVEQARRDLSWAQERDFGIVELTLTNNDEGQVVLGRLGCELRIGLKLFEGKYQLYVPKGNRPVSPEVFEALLEETCPHEKP